MRLISLTAKNYRQHVDTRIEFANGLTALIGSNGSGKSTILEMVTFAGYGEQRSTKDSIPNLWSGSKKFSVTFVFELNGRTYEQVRTESTASLTDVTASPTVIASGLVEASKAFEKLVGLSHEELINSFVVEQKGLAFLSFKSNADKQERISHMLGLDRLKVAQEAAKAKAIAEKAKVEALTAVMGDLSVLESAVADAKCGLVAIERLIEGNAIALKSLEPKRVVAKILAERASDYSRITVSLTELAGRFQPLTTARENALKEKAAADFEVATREALTPDANQFSEVDHLLRNSELAKQMVDKRKQVTESIAQAKADLQTAELDLAAITIIQVDGLEESLRAVRAELKAEESKAATLAQIRQKARIETEMSIKVQQANLERIRKAKKDAEEKIAAGVCPSCNQPIGESAKAGLNELVNDELESEDLLEYLTDQLAELQGDSSELVESVTKVSELRKQIESIEVTLEQGLRDRARRQELTTKVVTLKNQLALLHDSLASLPQAFDEAKHGDLLTLHGRLKSAYAQWSALAGSEARLERAIKAVADSEANLSEAKAQNAKLRAERDALGFKQEGFTDTQATDAAQSALEEAQRIEIEWATLQTEGSGLAQRLTQAESAVASAENRIAEYRQREVELAEAKKSQALYQTLQSEMKALRLKLNAELRPDLADRASEILSLLTSGRYNLIELDEKFNASLIDEGVTKTVISGGEEDAVAISLRLALAEMLQEQRGMSMSLLILDEVITSFDAERKQAFLDMLSALKTRFPQIVLISHLEGVNEVADRCLYLTRDAESRKTIVSDTPEAEGLGEAA